MKKEEKVEKGINLSKDEKGRKRRKRKNRILMYPVFSGLLPAGQLSMFYKKIDNHPYDWRQENYQIHYTNCTSLIICSISISL